ncbi:MAG: response regulator [Pseudomonadota bacterium]
MFENMSIKRKMVLVYLASSCLFVALGAMCVEAVRTMSESTAMLYEHPLSVSNAALNASMSVKSIQSKMSDLQLAQGAFDIREIVEEIRRSEAELIELLDIVRKDILGEEGRELERQTRRLVMGWKPLRDLAVALAVQGKPRETVKIAMDAGADQGLLLETRTRELNTYARRKAEAIISAAEAYERRVWKIIVLSTAFVVFVTLFITVLMIRSIMRGLSSLHETINTSGATGKLVKAETRGRNEIADMARGYNLLVERLGDQLWLREGLEKLGRELSSGLEFQELAGKVIGFISRYVNGCAGAVFLFDQENKVCRLASSFALAGGAPAESEFSEGQGLVGQVAMDRLPIRLRGASVTDLVIRSGVVSEAPSEVYLTPLFFRGNFLGVLEVASFGGFEDKDIQWIDLARETGAAALHAALQNRKIVRLLTETRQANDELVAANDELRAQGEELRAQARELKSKRDELELQRSRVEEADRLKSEFLSNMSHELRTPLNSIMALSQLMLSKGLGEGREKEVEFLKVIERNGRNLLNLINEILDLSKIESGKVEFAFQDSPLMPTVARVLETIGPLAQEKGVALETDIDETLTMETDPEKISRILLNLLANALKFTEKGRISLSIHQDDHQVVFRTSDTGIGIPEESLEEIFEEFRQVDGSTTRRFQGTGLGLSISRKLARLLGGDITVESKIGEGSVFSLALPRFRSGVGRALGPEKQGGRDEPSNPAARAEVGPLSLPPILVIHRDPERRRGLEDFLAKRGFNATGVATGKDGLDLARRIRMHAVILEGTPADMSAWEALTELGESRASSDAPVIILVAANDPSVSAFGEVGRVGKPWDGPALASELDHVAGGKEISRIFLLAEDSSIRDDVSRALEKAGRRAEIASGGFEVLTKGTAGFPDAVVLDISGAGPEGGRAVRRLRSSPRTASLPVVCLTGRDMSETEEERLFSPIRRIKISGCEQGDELFETLGAVLDRLPEKKDELGKPKLLIVEDNEIAALQILSAVEEIGVEVILAVTGTKALEVVERDLPDAVVLDLMMPEVDGFQVLEELRSRPATARVPVLVLTAKEITAAELARLSHNSIKQLVQKGTVDRKELQAHVRDLLAGALGRKPAAPAPSPERPAPAKGLILIVEDNPDNLLTVTALLDFRGYRYITASDGEKALASIRENRPALVLMDIQLPGLDGLDVARTIKRDENFKDIKIIALTAKKMKGDRERLLASGCDDYLAKPIDPDALYSLLGQWM